MQTVRILGLWAILAASGAGAQQAVTSAVAGAAERTARAPVLMVGDSMMRLLSVALEKEFRKQGIEAASFASLGSGLVRLDAFDWYAKISGLMDTHKPGTVIVVLGTNDDQPLLDEKGQTVNKGTDAWDLEYSKRLGKIMDTFLEHGALRVIWLLQPDMKQAAHQRYADRLNALITAEAGTRPAVLLFDSRAVLCRRPGAPYSATLVGKDGQMIQVRDSDGVHLSRDGAERLAVAVVAAHWK